MPGPVIRALPLPFLTLSLNLLNYYWAVQEMKARSSHHSPRLHSQERGSERGIRAVFTQKHAHYTTFTGKYKRHTTPSIVPRYMPPSPQLAPTTCYPCPNSEAGSGILLLSWLFLISLYRKRRGHLGRMLSFSKATF